VRNGRWAEISLKDHGRGLEPDQLRKIFRRFYRVELPNERVRGTGLGLYIVQSVIEGCGGTVRAESSGTGTGTTFTLQLPVVDKG